MKPERRGYPLTSPVALRLSAALIGVALASCGHGDGVDSANLGATKSVSQQDHTAAVQAAAAPAITPGSVSIAAETVSLSKAEADAQVYVANLMMKAQQDPFWAVAVAFINEAYDQDPEIDPDTLAAVIGQAEVLWRRQLGTQSAASSKLLAGPIENPGCGAEICAASSDRPKPLQVVARMGQMVLHEHLAIAGALGEAAGLSVDLNSKPSGTLNVGKALINLVPVAQNSVSWRKALLQPEAQWNQIIQQNTAPALKAILSKLGRPTQALDKSCGTAVGAKTTDSALVIRDANPELADPLRGGSPALFAGIQPDGSIQIDMRDLKASFANVIGSLTDNVVGETSTALKQMSGELDAVIKGQDDILGWIGAETLRREQQADAEQDAARRAMAMEAAQSSVYVLSTLIGFTDPKLGQQVSVLGGAVVQIAEALNKFSLVAGNADLAGLGAAICSGNMLSAALSVASMFIDTGPSADEMILEQLGALSEQINGVREEMHDRFDRVDEQLGRIFDEVADGFAQMTTLLGQQEWELRRMHDELSRLHQSLSRLHRDLQAYLDAGFRRDLVQALTSKLGYEQIYGQPLRYAGADGFTGAEALFHAWATEHAHDALSAGNDERVYDPGAAPDVWALPLAFNVNYLSQYPAQRFGLRALNATRLSNPLDLSVTADAWMRLLMENPDHRQRMPGASVRLAAIDDSVLALETAVRTIAVLPASQGALAPGATVGDVGEVPNHDLWQALFRDYQRSADAVQSVLNDRRYDHRSEAMSTIDIWRPAAQATSPRPTLSDQTMDWCDGRPAGLAVPAELIKRDDIKQLYYAAHAAGIGKVRACLAEIAPRFSAPSTPPSFYTCRKGFDIDVTVRFSFAHGAAPAHRGENTIASYTITFYRGSITLSQSRDLFRRVNIWAIRPLNMEVKWVYANTYADATVWIPQSFQKWYLQNTVQLTAMPCADALNAVSERLAPDLSKGIVTTKWLQDGVAYVPGGHHVGTLQEAFVAHARLVSPSRIESTVHSIFENKIKELLTTRLREERASYYAGLAAELERPGSELAAEARQMTWYKSAIDAFAAVGLSRGLGQIDFLRALLYGPHRIFDKDNLLSYLATSGKADEPPLPVAWLAQATARRRALVSDDPQDDPGLIDRLLMAIADGTFVETRPMIALLRYKLDALKMTIDAENAPNPEPPMPEPLAWQTLGESFASGADLVSDGQTLYRVGGLASCKGIYRYSGIQEDSWTLITNDNPQCYAHRSPGEGNRSWYYGGKIIVAGHSHVGHSGGNTVTVYDLATDTWTTHDLPVFEKFTYGRQSPLNARQGAVQMVWAEADTPHAQASAAFDLNTLTWSATEDRVAPIAPFSVPALGDTSSESVFALQRGDRLVQLQRYDLTAQPADFSGQWTASSTHDLGEGALFMEGAWNYGSDIMAWDDATSLLYLVATQKGSALAYDPAADKWYPLPPRPEGIEYRDGHLAVARGWLYSQNGSRLWALNIDSMPASAAVSN